MAANLDTAQIVGVDGGATSVRACRVLRTPAGLCAQALAPARAHALVPGFVPVLREAAHTPPGLREHQAARAWIASVAACVREVLGDGPLLLGVAMPGLKTADGRGLGWLRHGPRAPHFLDELEARLSGGVPEWLAPTQGLFSDAVAAAEGERAAEDGLLRDVRAGWSLGGGTGLAEAAVLDGRALALDVARLGFPRAWELAAPAGGTYEARLSMSALVERCGAFPEERPDDARVRAVLRDAARDLAELLARRAADWRAAELPEIERVVVGQRLGALLADARGAHFAEELSRELERHDLPPEGWLVASAASGRAALGAASLACSSFEAHGA